MTKTEDPSSIAISSDRKKWAVVSLSIVFVVIIAWTIRMLGPSDFSDGDQMKPAAYIMDAVQSGSWIVQTDFRGNITSKPPLYTWLAAFVSVLSGGVTEFSMYLPTGLAMMGTALAAAWIGRHWFGNLAAFYGGIFVVLNPLGFRHVAFARTDALFTFFVTIAALFALKAFADRAGSKWWLGFWIAGAFASLTKGPLGILLAAFGMLAWFWERYRSNQTSADSNSAQLVIVHGIGILFALVVGGGWFALAYYSAGDAIIDKQISDELVGHAVIDFRPMPVLYFLTAFAPWSFFAVSGIFQTIRSPERHDASRRAERFLVCWILLGILLFCLFSHQRKDHLLPLVAPMAILGGREFVRLTGYMAVAKPTRIAASIAIAGLVALAVSYGTRTLWYKEAARSEAARNFAREVERLQERDGRLLPLTYDSHVDFAPFALGLLHDRVANNQILEKLLASGLPVFIVATRTTSLKNIKLPDGGAWHVWFDGSGKHRIGAILSNIEPGPVPVDGAFVAGDLIIRFQNAGYEGPAFGRFRFRPNGPATIMVQNTASDPKTVRIEDTLAEKTQEVTLGAGDAETLRIGESLDQ